MRTALSDVLMVDTKLRFSVISLAAFAMCVIQSGCVRRRMIIRSQPAGALVFVDDQEVGVTPTATNFTYYGTRKIQLIKDGFETSTVLKRVDPPWYEVPPLDLFSEVLCPKEIRDEQVVDFQLAPQRNVPVDELIQHGQSLRQDTLRGAHTPLFQPSVAGQPMSQPAAVPGGQLVPQTPTPPSASPAGIPQAGSPLYRPTGQPAAAWPGSAPSTRP